MKKERRLIDLISRYLILIILSFNSLWIFYLVFTPLTIYPVYFLSKLFFQVTLQGNTILFPQFNVAIINACIAGAAYYLLLILNLSTPAIIWKKRIKSIAFSFGVLLLLNIIRIFSLILVFKYSTNLFSETHMLFWYFLSTIFVVGIWFLTVKIFKITEIPVYSDMKYLFSISSLKRKVK